MKPLNTPEEQVVALGDEQLMTRHLAEESDLNELIELVNLLRERLSGWSGLPVAERQRLLSEREELMRHGDRLASEPVVGGSPLLTAARREVSGAWQAVREQLQRISGDA
jgi:hypothetical protein